jgi:nucleoid-associated protein YgaU
MRRNSQSDDRGADQSGGAAPNRDVDIESDNDGGDAGWSQDVNEPATGGVDASIPRQHWSGTNRLNRTARTPLFEPTSRNSTFAPTTDSSDELSAEPADSIHNPSATTPQLDQIRPSAPPAPLDPLPGRADQGIPDQLNSPGREPETTHQVPVRPSPRTFVDERYIVQPNDNFWRISSKLYGTARYFKALESYNDKMFPHGTMRPGDRVETPPAATLEQMFPDLISKGAPKTNDSGPSAAADGEPAPEGAFQTQSGRKMYRVKSTDTLFDIAKSTLGRGARWQEIYELNRELIADPNRLKPGTVLRLPNAAEIDNVAGTTRSSLR